MSVLKFVRRIIYCLPHETLVKGRSTFFLYVSLDSVGILHVFLIIS